MVIIGKEYQVSWGNKDTETRPVKNSEISFLALLSLRKTEQLQKAREV